MDDLCVILQSAVGSVKILGVTISSDLKWNEHISECIKKANKRLYFIVLLKRANVPLSDIVHFYCTVIRLLTIHFQLQWKPLYLVIYSSFLDLPSHSHGKFTTWEERWKSPYSSRYPQQQTALANVMVSLKSVNKLPNTRVFIAAEKWRVRSTGVGGLISLQNGNLRR